MDGHLTMLNAKDVVAFARNAKSALIEKPMTTMSDIVMNNLTALTRRSIWMK
jgi:hypothetical protein